MIWKLKKIKIIKNVQWWVSTFWQWKEISPTAKQIIHKYHIFHLDWYLLKYPTWIFPQDLKIFSIFVVFPFGYIIKILLYEQCSWMSTAIQKLLKRQSNFIPINKSHQILYRKVVSSMARNISIFCPYNFRKIKALIIENIQKIYEINF